MWRCLVEKNVRAGQVGCGNEHGPMVANDRHKLEEEYEREYKDMVKGGGCDLMWCVGSKAILSHPQGFLYHVQQLGGLQWWVASI